MFKIPLISLFLACIIFAGIKTEVTKLVKADTTVSVKQDTARTIVYDTLKITKTYKDSLIFVKADTVKVSSKPQALPKAQPVPVKK
jgi:hypothetical protein